MLSEDKAGSIIHKIGVEDIDGNLEMMKY